MAVKAKPKPKLQIELPPEDVPFDDVIRRLLATPPSHDHAKAAPRKVAKKRARPTRRARS